MQKFQLELLFRIIGLGSASGLFFNGSSLFLISDNSQVLYRYETATKKLEKVHLQPGDTLLENIPKKDKPDYEAMAEKDGDLYLFGSGSTEKRNSLIRVSLTTGQVDTAIDLADLYLVMQDFSQIGPEDFNIEAVVSNGGKWYFFNRGNGPTGQNGIFTLEGDFGSLMQILYNPIELPTINGVKTSFTDAVKLNGKLYFLAAAEASASTYKDGEVSGTIIGRIDIEKMEVEFTEIISHKNKFEGITLYKENSKSLEFLLCEDTDSDSSVSDIYRLVIYK